MEKEPKIFSEVREVLNALPEECFEVNPLFSNGNVSKHAFLALKFLITETPHRFWSHEEVISKYPERFFGKQVCNSEIENGVLLLVFELDNNNLLDWRCENGKREQFRIMYDYDSLSKLCGLWANLGEEAGVSERVVNRIRDDSQFLSSFSRRLAEVTR